jgi:hypothetical protein
MGSELDSGFPNVNLRYDDCGTSANQIAIFFGHTVVMTKTMYQKNDASKFNRRTGQAQS